MKKIFKWVFVALVAVFVLLQFTNPARTNPPVINDFAATNLPPPAVAALLHAACYDCHSHETKWPLYSKIAPSSWLVVGDVNEGRKHLDLSDWPKDAALAAKKIQHMSDEIDDGDMPPKKYTAIHTDARLTDAQRKELTDWLDARAEGLKAAPAK